MTSSTNPRAPAPDEISEVERFDLDVAVEVRHQHRNPFVRWAGKASEIADQPQLLAVCGCVVAAGLLGGRPALTRTGLRMLAAFGIATGMKSWLKARIRRTRPKAALDKGRYEMEAAESHDGDEGSFPSGHTAGAVAVAGAVASEHPRLALPAFGLAAAIAAIQVPRGKHYPSDLAAGFAVGLAATALAAALFAGLDRATGRHDRPR